MVEDISKLAHAEIRESDVTNRDRLNGRPIDEDS